VIPPLTPCPVSVPVADTLHEAGLAGARPMLAVSGAAPLFVPVVVWLEPFSEQVADHEMSTGSPLGFDVTVTDTDCGVLIVSVAVQVAFRLSLTLHEPVVAALAVSVIAANAPAASTSEPAAAAATRVLLRMLNTSEGFPAPIRCTK